MDRLGIGLAGVIIVLGSLGGVACGGDGGGAAPDAASVDGAAGPDGGGPGPDAGGADPDGGGPGLDGGGPGLDGGVVLPSCYKSCTGVMDCVLGNTLHDADNYQCDTNRCRWTGCNSATECAEAFMDSSYVCGTLPGLTIPSCYKSCQTPAQCDLGNSLHDADNYQCTAGLCYWTGCNTSAECADAYMDASYLCSTLPTLPFPSCYKSCVTPADCAIGTILNDADNYQCTGGVCEWTGCNDSAECVAAYMDNAYVCE